MKVETAENPEAESELLRVLGAVNLRTFEILGILSAICALFLAIPLPEVLPARESLIMIQFLSLFALSMGTAIFALVFVFTAEAANSKLEKTFSFELGSAPMFFLFAFFGLLIFHLWKYMLFLYSPEWQIFMRWSAYAIGALTGSVSTSIYKLIYLKWRSEKVLRLGLSILTAAAMATLPSVWGAASSLSFDLKSFFVTATLFTSINLLLLLVHLLKIGRD